MGGRWWKGMDTREVFSIISAHQIKGLMLHSTWADYFAFLGLEGFKKLHEYRYVEESKSMRMIRRYFIEHYNELPIDISIDSNLSEYVAQNTNNRFDVDNTTKERHIKLYLQGWVEWEKESKRLYENTYKTLSDNGEIAGSCIVEKLVTDTDKELADAENLLLLATNVGFNMNVIILKQEKIKRDYDGKLKNFKFIGGNNEH